MAKGPQETGRTPFSEIQIQEIERILNQAQAVDRRKEPRSEEDRLNRIDNLIAQIIEIIQEVRANIFNAKDENGKHEFSLTLEQNRLFFEIATDTSKWYQLKKDPPSTRHLRLSQTGYKMGSEKNVRESKIDIEYTSSAYHNIQTYLQEFRRLLKLATGK